MGNFETILHRSSFLLLVAILLLPATVIASDELNQYGLGADSFISPVDLNSSNTNIFQKGPLALPPSASGRSSNYQFAKDFEIDYQKYALKRAPVQNINEPSLKLDVEYLDKAANLNSPHHAVNSDLNNQLHNTSNEYQTRMGYRFKHVTPEASFNYSPDSYGFGEYYNYGLGVAVPVKDIFSLETRYGWNKFEKTTNKRGINDYQDWSVGVSTVYKGMKLKVDYSDMNAGENSQECGKLFPCEGKTVFSIIKNF